MRLLLVVTHPLEDSFTMAVAQAAREALAAKGHEVDWLDLYRAGFDPILTAEERRGYFTQPYDTSAVAPLVARLLAAEGLILVFPQWWFGFPAILKGFFDRVFVPGSAFAHGANGGLLPRLENMRLIYALTTTGSPWWIVRLVMGDPMRRLLKRGIASLCKGRVRFRMLSLHDMDRTTAEKRQAHLERVRRLMSGV